MYTFFRCNIQIKTGLPILWALSKLAKIYTHLDTLTPIRNFKTRLLDNNDPKMSSKPAYISCD